MAIVPVRCVWQLSQCFCCAQDVALDEDEDEEDDQEEDLVSESEDEDAFDADGAADEDGNLGDDEDADNEVDDAYIKRLERESRRLKVRCCILSCNALHAMLQKPVGDRRGRLQKVFVLRLQQLEHL